LSVSSVVKSRMSGGVRVAKKSAGGIVSANAHVLQSNERMYPTVRADE
jgi:hypothetical protein